MDIKDGPKPKEDVPSGFDEVKRDEEREVGSMGVDITQSYGKQFDANGETYGEEDDDFEFTYEVRYTSDTFMAL